MTGTGDGSQPQQQYDEWGRPIPPYPEIPQQYGYQQQPQQYEQAQQYQQAPYEQAPYGYDAYGQPLPQPRQQQQYADPGYGYQQPQQYDYGQQQYQQPAGYGQQQGYQEPQQFAPPPASAPAPEQRPRSVYTPPAPAPSPVVPGPARPSERVGGDRRPTQPEPGEPGYGTEEFTFVDDAEESADVIDWMKFSETRGERRDERRKRLRHRAVSLLVVLVLIGGGAGGYLWAKGRLFDKAAAPVAASTERTVVAVHLHDLNQNILTALLVSDPSGGQGATVLIPGALGVPTDGGGAPEPLGSSSSGKGSVDVQGNAATRDGLNTLLGANISSTWGLYTPFLQKLWDIVQPAGIVVDANTTITVGGKTLVSPGKAALHGDAATAYATYRAKGESPGAQLARFGQVLTALVAAMPQDAATASSDITQMGAVPDPSLPDSTLGAVLAALSTDAKAGKLSTRTLAVKGDGTLGPGAGDLVKQLLGGKVSDSGSTATVARVAIQDATGSANLANLADADMVNGGFTLVPGTAKAATRAASTVSYSDPARAADAKQVAQDLGLPDSAVRKVTTTQSVDVMVVLGQDFKG
ncbi:LytR C-terminal domain-containing protein [Streptacidiphilus cavernicola]|uniref:LytR C-terminal domain-containing protein n=1 Tax=Streptacidiphilus cavernicola TaxID=3342716 RepID=A0ABV6VRZ6_9ACTN